MNFTKVSKICDSFLTEKRNRPLYVSSVIEELDTITGGIKPGNLYALASRPGMGKTSFMLQTALSIALDPVNPRPVYIISLEMPSKMLAERFYSLVMLSVKDSIFSDLLENDSETDTVDVFAEGKRMLSKLDIFICDNSDNTVEDICKFCSNLENGVVFIDYLQLLMNTGNAPNCFSTLPEGAENRLNELAEAAKRANIPVVILMQLNRALESRPDKHPRYSDLPIKNADMFSAIVSLYRDSYYYSECDNYSAEISVLKKRSSKTIKCFWDHRKRMFVDIF